MFKKLKRRLYIFEPTLSLKCHRPITDRIISTTAFTFLHRERERNIKLSIKLHFVLKANAVI